MRVHTFFKRAVFGTIAAALAASTVAAVSPAVVEGSLQGGESLVVTKTVTTPEIAPLADVYFLADTTGSMGPAIANVKSNFGNITATLDAENADVAYGAGDYKDFQDATDTACNDAYAFNNPAPIGGDAAAAVSAWAADGGCDGPEAQLYALSRLADEAEAGWREDATRIIVWFGDAPGHDAVCGDLQAANGEPNIGDVTLDTTISALTDADITVIAVNVSGLDANFASFDYGDCPQVATGGQASAITDATGGILSPVGSSDEVADAILAALTSLDVTVTPVWVCDVGLELSFAPAELTVEGGTDAVFSETITATGDAPIGEATCTVDFLINGESFGDENLQTVTINVSQCTDLIADGGSEETAVDVGDVCFSMDGDQLTVTYTTTGDWTMTKTHAHLACDVADVPQTGSGNPKVGQFDMAGTHENLTEVSYVFDATCSDSVVAAHADVEMPTGEFDLLGEEIIREEGAWGAGPEFAGRNWAEYTPVSLGLG